MIPYGYQIKDGVALPHPEQVECLHRFIRLFLEGASFSAAKSESGVGLSDSSLRMYLRKGIYNGTSFYPAIVEEGTYERILAELGRRSTPGYSVISGDLPVKRKFRMEKIEGKCDRNAVDTASYLYSLIIPANSGRSSISAEDVSAIREWAGIEQNKGG